MLARLGCVVVFALGACGDDDDPCAPHGSQHGNHCHCDEGYERAADGLGCVAEVAGDTTEPGKEVDASETTTPSDVNEVAEAEVTPVETIEETVDPIEVTPEVIAPLAIDLTGAVLSAHTALGEDGSRAWFLDGTLEPYVLGLEVYESFGGPSEPGEVALEGAETSYATCGTCVLLQTDCEAHGDHFHCERTFMPEAGAVTFSALGTKHGTLLAGALDGVVFREVTIASDFTTTPVPAGQRLALARWAFSTALEVAAEPGLACGGHGEAHGDHCDCDNGYRADPADPINCIPD